MKASSYPFDPYAPYRNVALFSDRAVFWFTWLGVLPGVVLAYLNARRLDDERLRLKVLTAALGWGAVYACVLGLMGLYPDVARWIRLVALAATYALALFLQMQTIPVVRAHVRMGGSLASVWAPLGLALLWLLLFWVLLGAILYLMWGGFYVERFS